jgi:predicted nucleic acid-binding protein
MKKKFDCVEMKNEIQRMLLAEYEGLSDAERHARIERELLADPRFGPFLRRSIEQRSCVMEESSGYGKNRHLKVFVDTSVFGGCFDAEFEKESRWFFDEVQAGRFDVITTETVMKELSKAPEHVCGFVDDLLTHMKILKPSAEVDALRDAYIDAGILGKSSLDDAEHIASATVERVDLLVSWNFKHIVHFDKIRAYNGVNALKGYGSIDIRSPQEVIAYDE